MIKSNWFDFIYYTEIIFLSKNVTFLYILKIFFTMLHLKIFLEYWIILHIFRILLCVTSPLETPFLSFEIIFKKWFKYAKNAENILTWQGSDNICLLFYQLKLHQSPPVLVAKVMLISVFTLPRALHWHRNREFRKS